MTSVAFVKIGSGIELPLLGENVRNAFPKSENNAYLDEIEKRKNQDSVTASLSALLLLSKLLLRHDVDPSSLVLVRNQNGKPYFLNSPIEFSLSHSGLYAVAAISDSSRVGVDIEAARLSSERCQRLAHRFFSAAEKQKFDENPDDFLKIWTKKEAYVKMRGISLAELIKSDKEGKNGCREDIFFYSFDVGGHPVALCLEKQDDTVNFSEIDI